MAEHYTKNTIEASHYCRKCAKFTAHDVSHGILQGCKECMRKLEAQPKRPEPAKQESLF